MPEDRPVISTSRLSATDVARHSFTTVRRGFDPQEVRAYLESVARELQAVEQREEQLRAELAQAESRAEHPVLDEAQLTAALGHQSALVLRHAHEEATRVAQAAEEQAAALLHEAQQQASDLMISAESTSAERIAEAELAAAGIQQEGQQGALAAAEAARAEADRLLVAARDQGKALVEQAHEARRRVLTDAAQRRRGLLVQIEQLRAARDQLAERVVGVRQSVDAILEGLAGADDEARAAAAAVAGRPPPEEPVTEDLPPVRIEAGEVVEAVSETAPAPPAQAGPAPPEPAPAGPVTATPEGGAARSVDELFARIRASQTADGEGAGEASGAREPASAAGGDVDRLADHAALEARAEMLGPIAERLARRMKRVLQDDQNRLLDRLRGGADPDDLLGPETEQRAVYVAAAGTLLEEAVGAGESFAAKAAGGSGRPGPPAAELARPAADRLATTVVTLLRRRLGEGAAEAPADDAAERVHAAYREWRGERVERLVGDFALSAFSAGVLAGRRDGVRWVLAPGPDPACADCDDNALAGVLAAGQEFPTGHLHPPAHVGCRCLVLPTPG